MDIAIAVQSLRKLVVGTKLRMFKFYIKRIRTLPEYVRPARVDADIPGWIDIRLDVFANWAWRLRRWPENSEDLPAGFPRITTLDALVKELPRIHLLMPIHDGTFPPRDDKAIRQYLESLNTAVMLLSVEETRPSALPVDYIAFLQHTDGLYIKELPDIADIAIRGVVSEKQIGGLVQNSTCFEQLYEGWELSAVFFMCCTKEAYCIYMYGRNLNDDAKADEKHWAWRIKFTIPHLHALYIGDMVGFLDYYGKLYYPGHIERDFVKKFRGMDDLYDIMKIKETKPRPKLSKNSESTPVQPKPKKKKNKKKKGPSSRV